MRFGRETAHVGTDLGEQHLGCASVDAGDRVEQLDLTRERARELLDLGSESVAIVSSRKSICASIWPIEERVVAGEAALQRLAQRGDLLAQRAFG